jgi:regulatory protein
MPERDPVDIAARALQSRDRSRRQIDERLARAGVEKERRADALDTLERVGYVDDARYAAARAESLASRGYGDEAVRAFLGTDGLAAEVVEEAIGALEPEADRAAALAARLGATRRVAAQLARKGFAEEALERAFPGAFADGVAED